MQLLFAALLAMSITMLLIPLLMRWAGVLGMLDQPNARKVHANPIPRVGGIGMGIAMLVAICFWGQFTIQLQSYVLATVVLLAFGIADDRLTLSSSWKFTGQVLAALIVMYFGGVNVGTLCNVQHFEIPLWCSVPITLCVIVGFTNAMNLSDGLDGLAGGAALMCFSGILLLALTADSLQVALLCVVAMGAVLGFLRYNTFPARVFMGDAGSQLLGFSAAVFSLMLTQDRELPYSATLPLLLLGVPVIDTLTVMTERILDGKSPFKADRTHVHHRLLALGFDHHEAVMLIYGAQAMLMVLAWFLRYVSDFVVLGVFVMVALGVVTVLRQARQRGWQRRALTSDQSRQSWLSYQIRSFRQSPRIVAAFGNMVGISMLAYAALLMINGLNPPADVRVLATILGGVLVFSILIRRNTDPGGWVERGVLYVCALIAVSLDRGEFFTHDVKVFFEIVIFASLGIAIFMRLYLATDRRYDITPLDVLVLLIAVALPNLPGSVLSVYAAGWMVAKVVLLMYGIENLTITSARQRVVMTLGILTFLGALALSSGA